jgi:hypothetical protein
MVATDNLAKARLEGLLVIGRRLRLQYDAEGQLLPPTLAALLDRLESELPTNQRRSEQQ